MNHILQVKMTFHLQTQGKPAVLL